MFNSQSLIRTIFGLLLFFIAEGLTADQSIRRALLEDCSRALYELQNVPYQNRLVYLPYLRDLLRLDEDMVTPGIALPGPLDPTSPGLDQSLMGRRTMTWRSPRVSTLSRHEAKRCAVYILGTLAPQSIEALPELLMVADDLGAPDDLREQAWDTAQTIIAKFEEFSPLPLPPAITQELVSWHLSNGASRVKDVVRKLGQRIAPQLLFSLFSCDEPTCLSLIALLASVEHADFLLQNERAMQAILARSSATVRAEFYAFLVDTHPQQPELQRIAAGGLDDSSDVTRNSLLQALLRLNERNEQLSPGRELFTSLLHTLISHPTVESKLAYSALRHQGAMLAEFSADIGDMLSAVSEGPQAEQLIELLKVSPSLNARAFRSLSNRVYSKSQRFRALAIDALAAHPTRSTETLNLLGKLLKSLRSASDVARYRSAALEVADAFVRLHGSPLEDSFIPHFIDALSLDPADGQPHPAEAALRIFGKTARPALVRAASGKDPKIAARAKALLAEQGYSPASGSSTSHKKKP